tara:strand:- start:591 stop:788 length:198 start_codon:yes stop_codon:yes gene_type:complete
MNIDQLKIAYTEAVSEFSYWSDILVNKYCNQYGECDVEDFSASDKEIYLKLESQMNRYEKLLEEA